jgi:transcriptional regulator with XRE-family HTH domain
MTNIKEHLGSNIRRYRIQAGFSQAKLAEMVDMATNYLGLVENGKKFPSSDMIERIAAALGKDTTDLFVLAPIEQDWKETILSKMSMLIDIELKTLRQKQKT